MNNRHVPRITGELRAHILEMLRDPSVVKPANPANADIVLEEDE